MLKVGLAKNGSNGKENVSSGLIWSAQVIIAITFVIIVMSLTRSQQLTF